MTGGVVSNACTDAVDSLFDRSSSAVSADAITAVFMIVVPSGMAQLTVPVISTVSISPFTSVPMSQVTVPPASAHPADAESNVSSAGNTSVIATSSASSGPSLPKSMV